jgi:hypothetical protein
MSDVPLLLLHLHTGPDPSAVDPRKAEKAEKAKAKGNELFLAGE